MTVVPAAAARASIVVIAAAFVIAIGVPRATATMPQRQRSNNHGILPSRWRRRCTSSVLSSSQDLPILGRRRAEDRLQGCAPLAALRFRARQDRAEPHHCGLCQETARTGEGDQARPLPGPLALRDPLMTLASPA